MKNNFYTIPVDVGYALDYLSIALVKYLNCKDATKKKQLEDNYDMIHKHIDDQLSKNLLTTIILSPEYDELVSANEKIFRLVDKAKTDAVLASEVDSWNYKRFLIKQKIQKRFFDQEESMEIKIGYDQQK